MPVCPRCRVAFLEGEVHLCARPRRRATALWTALAGLYALAYGVMSYEEGRLVNPGVALISLLLLFGSLMIGVIHLLLTTFHLTARR